MSTPETTIIPSDQFDLEVRKSRHDINRISESRIEDITHSSRRLVDIGGTAVAMGVIMPQQPDYDETRLLVMPAPFGNGLSPSMVLRAMLLQRSVREGASPLIVLPNNTPEEYAYTLTPRSIAPHDEHYNPLEDLGLQQARALKRYTQEKTGGEVAYDVVGYSQAAAVAPFIAGSLGGVRTVISADAPNTKSDRSAKQLKKDFMHTKLHELNRAINDSEIHSLNHFQGLSDKGKMTRRQLRGLVGAYRGSRLPSNRMLHEAMASNSHLEDLNRVAYWQVELAYMGIARATKSVIFQEADFEEYKKGITKDVDSGFYELAGYGHEAADNIAQFAQFARTALKEC